jgi:hypothetical protein
LRYLLTFLYQCLSLPSFHPRCQHASSKPPPSFLDYSSSQSPFILVSSLVPLVNTWSSIIQSDTAEPLAPNIPRKLLLPHHYSWHPGTRQSLTTHSCVLPHISLGSGCIPGTVMRWDCCPLKPPAHFPQSVTFQRYGGDHRKWQKRKSEWKAVPDLHSLINK